MLLVASAKPSGPGSSLGRVPPQLQLSASRRRRLRVSRHPSMQASLFETVLWLWREGNWSKGREQWQRPSNLRPVRKRHKRGSVVQRQARHQRPESKKWSLGMPPKTGRNRLVICHGSCGEPWPDLSDERFGHKKPENRGFESWRY